MQRGAEIAEEGWGSFSFDNSVHKVILAPSSAVAADTSMFGNPGEEDEQIEAEGADRGAAGDAASEASDLEVGSCWKRSDWRNNEHFDWWDCMRWDWLELV